MAAALGCCYRCSKFRPVGDFEGSRRNCRPCLATLRKQNALRQKNKYRSPAASSGDGGGAQNNSSELKSSSSAEAHPHHSSKSNSPKSPQ